MDGRGERVERFLQPQEQNIRDNLVNLAHEKERQLLQIFYV